MEEEETKRNRMELMGLTEEKKTEKKSSYTNFFRDLKKYF